MAEVTFSSILVPLDFSASSERALRVGASLAARYAARLTLLHVVHLPMPVPTFDGTDVIVDYEVLTKHSEEAARAELGRLLEVTGLTGKAETLLEIGDPVTTILDAIDDRRVDLVVMGTHGRTGLSRLIMGSVTDRVLRTAPCPVLAVREEADAEAPTEKTTP